MTDEKRIEEAGLAGFVARSAKVLNELDITRVHTMDGTQYQGSSDFISDTDLKDVQHADMHESATEESAVPLLMAPVRRTDGEVLGVLYALQKTTAIDDGGLQYFDQADERGMIELAAEFGRTLQRIEKVESDANVISDLETLFHCSPEMLSESDLRRLTRIISRDVCRITNAQHCSTYLVDHESQEVWTQVEGLRRQIRLPMNNGLVGQVATNGDLVKIDDASQLNGVLVGDTSEVVQSVICCPIMGRKMKSMAVIQAFHAKSNFFTAHHVSMVQRIAKFASIALQNRAMLEMKASAVHRGLSIEMNRSRMHKEMSILLKEHLKCENVVLHEFVSPWDVLSSLGVNRCGGERGNFGECSDVRVCGNAARL
jgi:putative methionine-R-sulfoxide reductase with GAF domain